MSRDNVLILYNDAKERPKENALFWRYSGKTITHSGKMMTLTFGLPLQAESFRKNHKRTPFTHIFAHSRIQTLEKIFVDVHVTHYSIDLTDWYEPAFERMEKAKQEGEDAFIETVLEQFKQIVPQTYQELAKYCFTIFGRQLEWFQADFADYLKKKYPSLDRFYPDGIRALEFFQSLPPDKVGEIKAKETASEHAKIIGQSELIERVRDLISRAAETKTSVLIQGDSGAGKELVARAIHAKSSRKSKPLVCLNCAAISESLLESELFGHEKGAFTNATEQKIGKFEAANSGTLFLDEIGEMSSALQAKLLRVLEDGSFMRVGGNASIIVDVRVITATNRNLENEVAAERFRHDLFFRLRVLEIVVPSLCDRTDDIKILAEHFLDRFSKEMGRRFEGFTDAAMDALKTHHWPGNIRELKNVIERAVVLGNVPTIHERDLLLSTLGTTGVPSHSAGPSSPQSAVPIAVTGISSSHSGDLDSFHAAQRLIAVLHRNNEEVSIYLIEEWVKELRKYQDSYNISRNWAKVAEHLKESKKTSINHRKSIGNAIKKHSISLESLELLSKNFPDATGIIVHGQGTKKIWD